MSNIQTDELFTEQTDFAAFIQSNAIQAENRQLIFRHPLVEWTSMDTGKQRIIDAEMVKLVDTLA
ncbi:hypothetical protein [Vibrio sp. 10N]|uniref:hypothetical protein n=1 Tax=Vibrio sp. 10N TaxID=3058938 RepID=UPI0030C6C73E